MPRSSDVAIYVDAPAVKAGVHLTGQSPFGVDMGMRAFIEALRAAVKRAAPELSGIPEVLLDTLAVQSLATPYACLVCQHPNRGPDMAVNQEAHLIQVDILWIAKVARDGATETDMAIRSRLAMVAREIMADTTVAGTAVDIHIVATPMQRMVAYRTELALKNQPFTVMVLSVEALLVEDIR